MAGEAGEAQLVQSEEGRRLQADVLLANAEVNALAEEERARRLQDAFQPLPAPEGERPDMTVGGRTPGLVSEYRRPDGRLFCLVARYEPRNRDERKLIMPWAYGARNGRTGWHSKLPPGRRPLLGIHEAIQHFEARGKAKPALVVEGEKAWESARRLCGGRYYCVTWLGGTSAVEKSDWRALDGFPAVYIWPDNDPAGRAAAKRIAQILKIYPSARVFIVNPPASVGAGWDLADAEAEGMAVQ
jgi:hypothetical protein